MTFLSIFMLMQDDAQSGWMPIHPLTIVIFYDLKDASQPVAQRHASILFIESCSTDRL